MKPELKERIEAINRGEVPNGYKKTKIGILPSDWSIKKLIDLAVDRGSYGIGAPAVDFNENLPRYLRITDIEENGRITNDDIKCVDHPDASKYLLEENDLVFARTGNTTGKTYLYDKNDGKLVYAGFLIKYKILDDKASAKYVKYYTETDHYWYWVKKMSARSGQPGINSEEYAELLIPCPDLLEQQKIADILSTWDKAIELKEKLIEQKKEQKKGLMQRLLTGKVRLPGFEGEWKEVRLGSIGSAYNGLTGKNKEDFGSGKPYIPYKNVFNGSRINIDQLEYVQILETENQNKVKYGDIIFTASSETPEEVGMSSVLLDHVDELYLNSFCFGYRLNDFNTLIPEFAQYLFRGNVFRKELLKLAQGSTRFNLSKNEVLKIKIKIPGLEEQKKIAFVLTIFDREIDLLEQELEALKQQKKGLMQLLLTGKVRVKC